jgi:hypothetical protein
MRKVKEHFRVLYNQLDGFGDELKSVINRSLTISEFKERWAAMLNRYKLYENSHLKCMNTQS